MNATPMCLSSCSLSLCKPSFERATVSTQTGDVSIAQRDGILQAEINADGLYRPVAAYFLKFG